MLRRCSVLILVLATVVTLAADVFACGDKFLRVGRSSRFRGYASVHRSTVLVYAPRWKAAGIKAFEGILTRGGHTATTVTTAPALAQAFATVRYNLVIADHQDAAAVGTLIDALPEKPLLLPVVYKATKRQQTEARAKYVCLLRPDKMNDFQALAEIDRLFDLDLKGRAMSAERR